MFIKYLGTLCLGVIIGLLLNLIPDKNTARQLSEINSSINQLVASSNNKMETKYPLQDCDEPAIAAGDLSSADLRALIVDTLDAYHTNKSEPGKQDDQHIVDVDTRNSKVFSILELARQKGSWNAQDTETFNSMLKDLSGDEIFEFNRRLAQGINNGSIEVLDDGALF